MAAPSYAEKVRLAFCTDTDKSVIVNNCEKRGWIQVSIIIIIEFYTIFERHLTHYYIGFINISKNQNLVRHL